MSSDVEGRDFVAICGEQALRRARSRREDHAVTSPLALRVASLYPALRPEHIKGVHLRAEERGTRVVIEIRCTEFCPPYLPLALIEDSEDLIRFEALVEAYEAALLSEKKGLVDVSALRLGTQNLIYPVVLLERWAKAHGWDDHPIACLDKVAERAVQFAREGKFVGETPDVTDPAACRAYMLGGLLLYSGLTLEAA